MKPPTVLRLCADISNPNQTRHFGCFPSIRIQHYPPIARFCDPRKSILLCPHLRQQTHYYLGSITAFLVVAIAPSSLSYPPRRPIAKYIRDKGHLSVGESVGLFTHSLSMPKYRSRRLVSWMSCAIFHSSFDIYLPPSGIWDRQGVRLRRA